MGSEMCIRDSGNIFVVDRHNRRILLLDDHLSLRRVIIDEHQLNYKSPSRPWRLCYREDKGQLMVGLDYLCGVVGFDVLCR